MKKRNIALLAGLAVLASVVGFKMTENPLRCGKYRLEKTKSGGTSFDAGAPIYSFGFGSIKRNYQLGTSYLDSNNDGLVDVINRPLILSKEKPRPRFVFDRTHPLKSSIRYPTPLYDRQNIYRTNSIHGEEFKKADATLRKLIKAAEYTPPCIAVEGHIIWGPR